jgi:hypothetical protein
MSPTPTIARLACFLALSLLVATPVRGERPADLILKLVPPDSALTFAVEDLRGNARAFNGSPMAESLRKLPTVKDWLASDRFRGFKQAMKTVEQVLGVNVATVRDELLGEAVVLSLRLPPGDRPEQARGLLLSRVHDLALLGRLIEGLNASSLKNGELERVSTRERSGVTYHVREFRPGMRVNEYYTTLGDRVFAWSNSEDLIRGVIDRQAGESSGLADSPDFQKVRQRMPERAVMSLFVDPRFVERLMASAPHSADAGEERVLALFGRYLTAVRYFGAAVEWRDGFVLHTEEVVDASRLSPALSRWAGQTAAPAAALHRIPSTALAMATAHVDFGILLDGVDALIPKADHPKLDNLILALDGLLLGLDLRTALIPHLGPGALAYIERPDADQGAGKMPVMVSVEIDRGPAGVKAAAALDNALRTLLAVYALDDKHGGGRLRVESKSVGKTKITALNASTPLAYAVTDGRLILGTTAGAVARALAAQADPHAGDRVARFREAFFPRATSFALADLRAIHDFADHRRPALAHRMAARQNRPVRDTARDLDQVLALIALFDASFLTSAVDPDFSRVHRTLGLVKMPPSRP